MFPMVLLLLDPRCWEVGSSKGCHLVTQRELLRAPFARQQVLNRSGSLLEAQREKGLQTQLPGVQVAVWLELGRTDTQRWSGIGCSPR